MAYFKPRFKRRQEGGYLASYGKGSKKMTGLIDKDDRGWLVPEVQTPFESLRDAKGWWEHFFEEHYENDNMGRNPLDRAEMICDPTDDPIPPPPPSARPKPPPSNQYMAPRGVDGFYDDDGNLTALGCLAEVWQWAELHVAAEHRWTLYPWANVAKTLQQAFPDGDRFKEPQPVEK